MQHVGDDDLGEKEYSALIANRMYGAAAYLGEVANRLKQLAEDVQNKQDPAMAIEAIEALNSIMGNANVAAIARNAIRLAVANESNRAYRKL